jgi:hypothetical protein
VPCVAWLVLPTVAADPISADVLAMTPGPAAVEDVASLPLADVPSQAGPSAAAAFQGVCVEADSPGTAGTGSRSAPATVDLSPDEDDRTGVQDYGSDTEGGVHARACVIPSCGIVIVGPPWYDFDCVDEWATYLCGRTCNDAVSTVERAICSSCIETDLAVAAFP